MTGQPTLGVDVGGVIVVLADRGDDTSFFGGRPLETPAVSGVFDELAALAGGLFEGRVHVVSKAGPAVAANTRAWLVHHRFFDRVGIPPSHVHFVRERRDKAPVCRWLGITHFVDDRLDVLAELGTVEHRYLFTGGRSDEADVVDVPDWAVAVASWADLAVALHRSKPSR